MFPSNWGFFVNHTFNTFLKLKQDFLNWRGKRSKLAVSFCVWEKHRPLNLVPKKPCRSEVSELPWHLMSKLYGFVVRWLFVSRNGIKMHFLSVVGFKTSTLTVYYLSSWFIHKQPKTFSNLCVLYWLSHLS